MGERKRKYLIFMFGGWETVEASGDIIKNIREVMQTIVNGEELTFVTGNNVVIMCISSTMGFEEIEKITHEFLTNKVDSFFLMPKPRKLAYRLDYTLEDHLFGNGSVIHSPIYRKSLNDSLSFHFSNVSWIFSDVSTAYGSAMIAALSKDKISINIKDIIKGDYLVSS